MSRCVKGIKVKSPGSNPVAKVKIGSQCGQFFPVASPQNEVEFMSSKLSCQGGSNG